MKNYIIYLLLVIGIFTLSNCNCEHCVDNISVINKKIPYADSSNVYFKNDTLGIVIDTVFVKLGEVSTKPYACFSSSNNDDRLLCTALTTFTYSNYFSLTIYQTSNESFNNIIWHSPYGKSEFIDNFILDTIEIFYKNKNITAMHLYYPDISNNSDIWLYHFNKDSTFVYNNYIYIIDPEIKLLQYSTIYKDGTRRIWKLKE